MPEETSLRINTSGSKRVRIVSLTNSTAEEHTTPTRPPADVTPLATTKNSSATFLSKHLPPVLQDFIKPFLKTFASSYATCFYKKIKSNDLRSTPSHVPSSTKFDFKPMLLDGIKMSKNAITLSKEVTAYVEKI